MSRGLSENKVEVQVKEINASFTMQLATTREAKPWICTVYFVIHNRCFYWLSYPERRHSQDLAYDSNAAVAIVLRPIQPVVGIQAEGSVEVVNDIHEAEAVLDRYIAKYNQGSQFLPHFAAGTNKHVLYRFTPSRLKIFDERKTRGRVTPEAEAVIV